MSVILAVNAGSSSVKISCFEEDPQGRLVAEAEVSGISTPPAKLKIEAKGTKETTDLDEDICDQKSAFQAILGKLLHGKSAVINNQDNIEAILHRVVHGGDYDRSQEITSQTLHKLEELTELAPLHNGPALEIVKLCISRYPKPTNYAIFDTQFHRTIPKHIQTLPIDQKIAHQHGLRKYGFHGISYAYITSSVAKFLSKSTSELNIIALHLGSGSSACVIQGGKSINTTMSLTPLDGLPGSSRAGSLDPSLIFHYAANVADKEGSLHVSRAEAILNSKAGWKSLSGTSDFSIIARRETEENRLAFDIMVDRITQTIGSYFVSLGGRCDALVFAGGLGEKCSPLRDAVVKQVECLGFKIDRECDGEVERVCQIGDKVLICHTDEARQMFIEFSK